MKKIFSFRLYLEGLKRLRLLGLATGIVLPLLMIVQFVIRVSSYVVRPLYVVSQMEFFAFPLVLLLIATPFFIYQAFSFLNKRKAADFYHSIPYRRICIYFSNLAAVYTWIFGILLLSVTVSMVAFANTVPQIDWTMVVFTLLLFAVAALFIGSVMLFSMTLTGTAFAGGVLFLVLALGFRLISWIVVSHLESQIPLIDFQFTAMKLFSMETSIFAVGLNAFFEYSILYDPTMWVFTVCVTLLFYVLAGVFFVKRRSETAGKTGSINGMQHFYSCGFSLPLALLTTSFLLKYGFARYLPYTALFAVGTVVVFYLCEMLSYKKILKSLKATPLLGAVILLCGIFAGGSLLCRNYVNSRTFDPEEIESVRFYSRTSLLEVAPSEDNNPAVYFLMEFPFPGGCDFEIKDRDFVEMVADLWASPNQSGSDMFYYVSFQLKDGSAVGRKLIVSADEKGRLYQGLHATQEYRDAYVDLVEKQDLSFYSMDLEHHVGKEIGDIFWQEYNSLQREEKYAYFVESNLKAGYLQGLASYTQQIYYAHEYVNYGDPVFMLSDEHDYPMFVILNKHFPKTIALLNSKIAKRNATGLSELKEFLSLEEEARLKAFRKSNLYISMEVQYGDFNAYISLSDDYQTPEDDEAVLKKLDVLSKIILNDSENFYGTDDRYSIQFTFDYNPNKSFRTDYYPIAYDGMDSEFFKDVIRASSSGKVFRYLLEPDHRASSVAWTGKPFQIMLIFSNGEEYVLSVTDENYDRFLEVWDGIPTKFWDPDKPVSVGDEGTVEIYISTYDRNYYGILRTVELPEEIKERLRNFS